MKKLLYSAFMLLAICGCAKEIIKEDKSESQHQEGKLNVSLVYEFPATKAVTDYVTVLEAEKAEKKVVIYVFDKSSGQLNISMSMNTTSDAFNVTVPVGEKTIYAVVNGPDLSDVFTLTQMANSIDNLADTELATNGLTMIGAADCTVTPSGTGTASIIVRRLVSRVVLEKVTNSLPAEYGHMTIDAVYLGNANSVQTFAGISSSMVNPSGYADDAKTKAIGKNDITGSCSGYMFKKIGSKVNVGNSYSTKQYMYCQPNLTSTYTTLHMLVTIGTVQYYYKVPLTGGVKANYTYSVEANIVNLGTDKPDEELVKGELNATVTVAGWSAGDRYSQEF